MIITSETYMKSNNNKWETYKENNNAAAEYAEDLHNKFIVKGRDISRIKRKNLYYCEKVTVYFGNRVKVIYTITDR